MFDIKELKKQDRKNKKERLKFIDEWCNYIKNVSNREWSSQQAELINGQIREDMI